MGPALQGCVRSLLLVVHALGEDDVVDLDRLGQSQQTSHELEVLVTPEGGIETTDFADELRIE